MIRTAPPASPVPCLSAKPLAQLLSVLNHEIRLEILETLAQREQDVSSIADILDLSVRTVSHHLTPLRKAGFVRVIRCKTRHIYCLTRRIECSVEQHQTTMKVHSGGDVSATVSVLRPVKIDKSSRRETRLRGSVLAPY